MNVLSLHDSWIVVDTPSLVCRQGPVAMHPSKNNRDKSPLIFLGDAMRNRRIDLLLTQEAIGEAAGLHRSYITDVEGGARNLSILTLLRLATALQWPISQLMLESEILGLDVGARAKKNAPSRNGHFQTVGLHNGYPTRLAELEACRQQLIDDISRAKKLFGAKAPEIRTATGGLRFVKQMIKAILEGDHA